LLGLKLGLGLGLAEIRFRSNVFLSKCSGSLRIPLKAGCSAFQGRLYWTNVFS